MRGRTGKVPPKLPPYVFEAIPTSLTTIGLFEWEVPVLKTKAKRHSISLRIKPHTLVWDQNSKKAVATMWNLDHDSCPFLLEDDKCRIYENRPLVCQTYPLMAIGLLPRTQHTCTHKPYEISLGDCPNTVKLPWHEGKPFLIRFSTVFDMLFEVYGSTFLGALRYDLATILLSKYFREARSRRIIRPAILKKNVIKAIMRSDSIGLLEFLQVKGTISKKEIQKEIQGIYSLTMKDLKRIRSGQ